VDPRSSHLVMRTSLLAVSALAILLLSSCAAADPPASSEQTERAARASVGDTEMIRAVADDFYDEEAVGSVESSSTDGWVRWNCQLQVYQHSSQFAYRLLHEMYLRYGGERELVVSVVHPAPDGTGAKYLYFWNPSSQPRNSSSGTTLAAETISGIFAVSDAPVIGRMSTGRTVATITASPDQVREYAAEREPPGVTATYVAPW